MIKKVVMPAAGQTTDVATVTKLKVAVGDTVKKGDVLLEVETDKAVLPIESFAKGFITEIYVNEFDTVDAGTPLLAIGDANDLEAAKNGKTEAVEAAPAVKVEDDDEDDFVSVMPEEKKESVELAPVTAVDSTVKAMPNAKRLASALGVELEKVTASNGVFIKEIDVKNYAEANKAAESAKVTEGESIPVARMRNTLARRLDESANIPVFTVGVSVCGASYEKLAENAAEITPAHYVMLALARLSARYPILRAVNEGMKLPLSDNCRAGIAVCGENGTVTSVIENAASLGALAIARKCNENREAICKGDLTSVVPAPFAVHDMTKYAIDSFTAPVTAPSVAAFGVTYKDGKISVQGSFDMRVIEGHIGASIMADLAASLENPVLMLI